MRRPKAAPVDQPSEPSIADRTGREKEIGLSDPDDVNPVSASGVNSQWGGDRLEIRHEGESVGGEEARKPISSFSQSSKSSRRDGGRVAQGGNWRRGIEFGGTEGQDCPSLGGSTSSHVFPGSGPW